MKGTKKMKDPQLLFDIIQNMSGEYPQFAPYSVIKLATKGETREGYTSCDEYGRSNWLGAKRNGEFSSFLAINENTKLAFLGERFEEEEKVFLKVIQDESIEEELIKLIKEYSPKEKK